MELAFDPDQTQERDLEREDRLQRLGSVLAEKLKEAIDYRRDSGIEDVWLMCEEAYLGIDDANRQEFSKAKWAKPTSMDGPVTKDVIDEKASKVQSKVFVRLTSRYVDAGAAKMQEILLPIDDKPFSFKPSPVPEVISVAPQSMQQNPMAQAMGQMGQPPAPGMPPGGAMPPMGGAVAPPQGAQQAPQPAPMDQQVQIDKQAAEAAKRAEQRIHDWMVEGGFAREMRKVIHDSARIGVGVLKAPFAKLKRNQSVSVSNNMTELKIVEKVVPGCEWTDPWNLFPDPACGENIHDGDYLFERDFMSSRKLRDLKKMESSGYIPDAIDKVLKEGPGKCLVDSDGNPIEVSDPTLKRKRFEIYYYYGIIDREDMAAMRAIGIEDLPEKITEVYAVVTLVNDTPIRAVMNPLDSGAFPHKVMPWTRRAGHWAGVGVAEQVKEPQRMCNAATRSMMNNAGKSGGSQIIIDNDLVQPANNDWTIYPDKVWHKKPGAIMDDVRKAFFAVQFPNVTPHMMSIIEYALRLAEESTNIPLITQGQSGQTTPDTLGGQQLQNNNANQLLRSIGYMFDDCITEPVVHDYYTWLLLDPDVPDDEKGDWEINAHGSASLVERAIQDQFLFQMGGMVGNPGFEMSPARWIKMVLKSKRIDPRELELTDEEKQRIAQQPPPEAPAVTAAKIRADAQLQAAQMANQTQQVRIKADTDRDTAYVNAEHEANMLEHQARLEELRMRRELAMLEYANKRNLQLEDVKSKLTIESAKINLQRELAAEDRAHQVTTPPVEPRGRAQPGKAFQQ